MKHFLLVGIAVIFTSLAYGQNTELTQKTNLLIDGPEPCVGGFAGIYPCDGYDLLSRVSLADMGATGGNDCWGWVDPLDQKEYALMGLNNGISFVDISNPSSPIILGHLATHTSNSLWRDVKVYQNHAYIVSEAGNHGMQIFDLTRLRNVVSPPETFTEDAHFNNFGSAHNIVINEESGFAYPVGANSFGGGPWFLDISNPTNPVFVGSYDGDGYTHDAQVVNYIGPDTDHTGSEIFFGSNANTLTIVDVSVKNNPTQLARVTYVGESYTHQGWLTEDHKYFLMDDETDELSFGNNTRTLIWDVQDLDNPFYIGDFISSIGSTDHNLYVHNGKAYQANYSGGLRVLNLSDIANANLFEEGYFDTYPANNNPGYPSAWSCYPYFPSGNIIISTGDGGLFVVKASSIDPVAVNVNVKVFLEGPYNNATDLMNDGLRMTGAIPLSEPYSAAGFGVDPISMMPSMQNDFGANSIVDWVVLELRNGNIPSQVLAAQAALVQRDGDIVSADGTDIVFSDIAVSDVFVVVKHRNHFGVRTLNSYPTSGPITVDITDPNTSLIGTDATIISSNTSLLISGDANGDGSVNSVDNNIYWRTQNGMTFDYIISNADFNLDGFVNSFDKNDIWRLNNGNAEQLD